MGRVIKTKPLGSSFQLTEDFTEAKLNMLN